MGTGISHSKLTLDLTGIMYRPYRPWEVSAAGLDDSLVSKCCNGLGNNLAQNKEAFVVYELSGSQLESSMVFCSLSKPGCTYIF